MADTKMPRPPHERWTLIWWVSDGRGHGDAGTVTFHDEPKARQTARDWTHTASKWSRAHVRLAKETRRVSLVQVERGTRWDTGKWEPAHEQVDGRWRPVVETWNHDDGGRKELEEAAALRFDGAQPRLPEPEPAGG